MEQRKIKRREPAPAGQIEQLLANRYNQLLQWGTGLTRGDVGKAQDIVQEFCLYFTLAKPDLSGVANLDGYLYTCLRHIYLSGLARASREAQHFVSVAEFDSFEFALAGKHTGDPLQRQNDLRRICGYAVWRKESSKTASYFIFHFFHGYSRREIAELACLPIAAIYNKLKIARTEVKSHLEETGKLRLMNRDLPPEPILSWGLLSSAELFRELRATIMKARVSDCLPEEELLAHYSSLVDNSRMAKPISCGLLAHIVSCEPCLAIIDRQFRRPTLQDREPLDGFESSEGSSTRPDTVDHKAIFRSIRRRWGSTHEHRPRTLSIAVDGRIVALHDVQSEHNMLSAWIEHPEKVQFVEVFSEQDVRLALLPIGDLPPAGPSVRSQRVALSDARWLELNLTFDGIGLNSQVAYFDPALGSEVVEDVEDSVVLWAPKHTDLPETSWIAAIGRFLSTLVPSSAMAWALALAMIVGTTGYLVYRHTIAPSDAREVLSQSIQIERTNLRGQTEHQVLHLEEVSEDGRVLQQGAVDLWKDGDGRRYLRRLYDAQHRLVAAEWRNRNGEHRSRHRPGGAGDKSWSASRHVPSMSGFWNQDLSASAFSMLDAQAPQIHAVSGGYELTTVGPIPGRPELISATLVLDSHLVPVREIMRVRSGAAIHELRFIQAAYERQPSSSVSDTVFDPEEEFHSAHSPQASLQQNSVPNAVGTDVQLAQLQIAVLYQLNNLDADTGEPIEVARTPDGRIRVSGTVADSSLKQRIVSRLETLEDHQLLDLGLLAPNDTPVPLSGVRRAAPESMSVYDVGQEKPEVDETLRRYLQTKGLSGQHLDDAIMQYSHSALRHAQRALQHAYALKRLGSALSAAELKSISRSSQQRWTEMVDKHATDLSVELRTLHGQLAEIDSSVKERPDTARQLVPIENSAQFDQAANRLLRQTQDLNSDVGRLFTSNPSSGDQPDVLLATTMKTIPLREAEEITHFAAELKTAGRSGLAKPQIDGGAKGIPEQP